MTTLREFEVGYAAPPGASAVASAESLILTWPSEADDRRFSFGVTGYLGGAFLGAILFAWFPGLTIVFVFLSGVVCAVLGVVGARLMPRSFITLTVTPEHLRLRTSGVLFSLPKHVPRSEVRDVLVIEEQDGEGQSGDPIMVNRLVVPLRSGGRKVLVSQLKRSEYGAWVEAAYAAFEKRRKAAGA